MAKIGFTKRIFLIFIGVGVGIFIGTMVVFNVLFLMKVIPHGGL